MEVLLVLLGLGVVVIAITLRRRGVKTVAPAPHVAEPVEVEHRPSRPVIS